jgi:hypothetical protein
MIQRNILSPALGLIMETLDFFEILVYMYEFTWCHNPEQKRYQNQYQLIKALIILLLLH